jgi:sugar fermentation stimulation protein A
MSTKRFLEFSQPLLRGEIISRPNRFIMRVKIGDTIHDSHCPVTGKIFNIDFKHSQKISCLVSQVDSFKKESKRKTQYTVEAISFDPDPENGYGSSVTKTEKQYVGINQIKANRYVEYFLSQNLLPFLPVEPSTTIRREVKIGNSKIDFLVGGNHYLEIKTPLGMATFKETPQSAHIHFLAPNTTRAGSVAGNRLLKHFLQLNEIVTLPPLSTLTDDHLSSLSTFSPWKASVCLVFLYDAPLFQPPASPDRLPVQQVVESCLRDGVSYHQINLRVSPRGVELIETMPLFSDGSVSEKSSG